MRVYFFQTDSSTQYFISKGGVQFNHLYFVNASDPN